MYLPGTSLIATITSLPMGPYDALGAAAAVLFGLFIMSQSCRRPSPSLIHERSQVVVITGGLSGLGRELAQLYTAADARVAILDIKDVVEDEACASSTRYYKCDVSNSNDVEAAVNQIESEVSGMKMRMEQVIIDFSWLMFISLDLQKS